MVATGATVPLMAQDEAPRVVVDSVPILRLGSAQDGPTGLYEVEDVVVHGDTLAVANRGSQEIRFFSVSDGRYLYSTGRYGQGPGEFEWLDYLEECTPGVLTAFDPIATRITTLTWSGEILGTRQVPLLHDEAVYALRCGPAQGYLALFQSWQQVDVGEAYRPMASLVVLPGDADSSPHVLTRLMGDERYRFPGTDGPRVFGKKTVFATWGDRTVVGTGDAPMMRVLNDRADTELFRLTMLAKKTTVDQSHIEFVTDRQVEAIKSYGESVVAKLKHNMRTIEYPRYFPPYSHLEVDGMGRLWVERYPIPAPGWRQHWEVFSQSGAHLASVIFPSGFTPLWIGRDRVAGKTHDEMGVEFVEVLSYSLKGDGR